MMKKLIAAFIVIVSFSTLGFATTTEEQRDELMEVNSHLLDYRSNRPATSEAKGTIELEAEILHMSNAENQFGVTEEPIDGVAWIPRFRARYYPTNFAFVGAGANPAFEYDGYSYGFMAAEAGATANIKNIAMTTRVYVADSKVEGGIVAKNADDHLHSQQRGIDFNVGVDISTVSLSAGIGYGQLDSELDVDGSNVEQEIVDRNYKYSTGSVAWSPFSGYRLGYSQNFTNGGDLQHWALNFTKTW